jgi:hypothetical protein
VVGEDITNTCPNVKKLRKVNIITIDQIQEDDGQYNGAQLSEIAYREDRWKLTKRDEVIPKEIMKKILQMFNRSE